jgi:TonB family protein
MMPRPSPSGLNSSPSNPSSAGRLPEPESHETRLPEPRNDPGFDMVFAEIRARFAARAQGLPPELSADLTLDIVLNEIVEQACLATGASGAAIALERDQELVCRASSGSGAPQLGTRISRESGLVAECIRSGRTVRCDDAEQDPRADAAVCHSLGVRSVMALPLWQSGNVVGVVAVFSARAWAFGDRDERTLEALSHSVLVSLARAAEPAIEPKVDPEMPQPQAYPDITYRASPATAADQIATDHSVDGFVANHSAANAAPKHALPDEAAMKDQQWREEEWPKNDWRKDDWREEAGRESDDWRRTEPAPDPQAQYTRTMGNRIARVATWILAPAVVASAVLLIMITGEILLGKRGITPRPVASSNGASPHAANEEGNAEERSAGSAQATNGPGNSVASASATENAASAAKAGPANAVPPGGLAVYENGKEVFRMSPGTAAAGANDTRTAASAAEPTGIYEISQQAAEENLLHRVEPEYPPQARQQQIQGQVVLEVRAGRDGAVQQVTLVSGQPVLAAAAIAAVKQWRFRPHLVNGHTVEMQARLTLNFKLSPDERGQATVK